MGRDSAVFQAIFGTVNKRLKTPYGNIIFIMLIELLLGSFTNPDQIAELINYGAVSGFILLNISVIFLGVKKYKFFICAKIFYSTCMRVGYYDCYFCKYENNYYFIWDTMAFNWCFIQLY